ncbi:hypothetical protein BJ878DRAFT_546907 [Calycina marina]|uniref:Uncharacterized protein n=1 Tax=Calycina marina TaxID=1763456 RepID=A0A9P7YVI6_9HELO|nr:hypothetical protein BJ878DRAFT_546907 [Calycina marina]
MAHSFANHLADITAADPSGSSIDIDSQLNYLQVRLGTPRFHNNGTSHWDDHWASTLHIVESTLRRGLFNNASYIGFDSLATRISHTTTVALPRPVIADPYHLLRSTTTADGLRTALANDINVFSVIQYLWAQNLLLTANLSSIYTERQAVHTREIDELDNRHTQDLNLLISRNKTSESALRSTIVNMMTAGSATWPSESENLEYPDKFDGTNPALLLESLTWFRKSLTIPGNTHPKESVAFAYARNGAMKLDNTGACDAFPTTQSVFDHIRIAFGDTDETFIAEEEIDKHRMGEGVKNTFSAFITKFLRIAAHLSWNDAAISHALYRGLHLLLQARCSDNLLATGRPVAIHRFAEFLCEEDAKARSSNAYAMYNIANNLFTKSKISITTDLHSLPPSSPPATFDYRRYGSRYRSSQSH